MDNTFFTDKSEYRQNSPEDVSIAIKELRRVLKPGGLLLITVPYGKYRNFGCFQQFDAELVSKTIDSFGTASTVECTYFRYDANGWNLAKAEDCSECEYVEWVAKAWSGAGWPDPLPVEKDRAATTRAVACISLKKK
jgi:hypothetical protein